MMRGLRIAVVGSAVAVALLAPAGAGAHPGLRGDAPPPSTSTSTLPSGATARLDAALLEAWAGLPGGALATVIVPGRGRWVGSVGYGNEQRGRPLVPAMQSPIGSVTKTFTAMLVLQETERGEGAARAGSSATGISLDDRLDRWYPWIPLADEITVAMLLNMSSGIADYLNGDIVGTAEELLADPKRRYRPDDLIAKGAAMPRAFEVPGSGFASSNTNTVILGQILEKETGTAYADLLRERLFGPLGLSRTFLDISGRLRAPHAQTYSEVYALAPSGPRVGLTTDWSQSIVWAAGGLASTIDNLGRWGRTFGTGRGAISASLAADRLDDCAPMMQDPSITVEYCLGVAVVRDTDSGKPITLWHNGRVFGAVAYLGYYPATGAVVAVMANSDLSGPDGEPVSMRGKAAIEAAVPGLLGLSRS
ncbi:MAG: serine hydrolase domain-containing protein [bacterium]